MALRMIGSSNLPSTQAPVIDHNQTGAPLLEQCVPSDCLVSLFERACEAYPARIAAVCGSEEITYSELNRSANRIAHSLSVRSIRRGDFVALCLDRSIEMVAAMLGVLKAGAAYLPIDPRYPQARVAQTLEDALPAAIVTNRNLAKELVGTTTNVLLIEELLIDDSDGNAGFSSHATSEDLAYLMYTSGSTGKPKGVLVSHRNVVRLLTETNGWFHFDENDVWTMFHSFAFDFSVWEMWGSLTTGGKLIIVPFTVSRSPEDFYTLLSEQKVTVLNQTPSAFSLLSQTEETTVLRPLALRVVIFGGEALQYRSLRNWFRRHGDIKPQLVNMYGITETTVHVTYRVVRETDTLGEPDSLIGVPIPDLKIHLLNQDLLPVEDDGIGEICVGGPGVARGYLNRPELTAERFISDPFSANGEKLYRSGDLARRRKDGELVYLGRGDTQVKINGFRIELGEVEAALGDYPGVQQVTVIAHSDGNGLHRLAAYFVMAGSNTVTAGELSSFLSKRLPPQMMPAFYTQLQAIPLTSNGKVDRASLPEPAASSGNSVVAQQITDAAGTSSSIQERVAQIWRHVLGSSHVGLDENFFDIGGTSVLLVAVRTELQLKLGCSIPVTWMFEFTTVRSLAEKISEISESRVNQKAQKTTSQLSAAQDQARRQREAFARLKATKGSV